MSTNNEIRFALSDLIDGVEVTPAHLPLSLLGEFQKDVSEFLRGSARELDANQIIVGIEEGSLGIAATGLLVATSLWADLQIIQTQGSLDLIDPKRAAVIERWQALALKNPERKYILKDLNGMTVFFVDYTTNYHLEEIWVCVEKFLHGRIVDWGGKKNPNVHLEMANGKSITIESSQSLIAAEEQNLVYKQALLHVTAEESLKSGELRNIRLIAFEHYQPNYSDDEFNLMVERGTKAWGDIKDVSSWLEKLRGGD